MNFLCCLYLVCFNLCFHSLAKPYFINVSNYRILGSKAKKRKLTEDETLEEEYEDKVMKENGTVKKIRGLLPIKTKDKVIPQTISEDEAGNIVFLLNCVHLICVFLQNQNKMNQQKIK